nr:hypothetical protein GCM10025732_41630 [Glycomyces mayteni]
MLGLRVRDVTAGYRAYRLDALQKLELDTVNSVGYCFQIDLTWRAVKAGFTISEIPIVFTERRAGASKMNGAITIEALWNVTVWGSPTAHGNCGASSRVAESRSDAPAAAAGTKRPRSPSGSRWRCGSSPRPPPSSGSRTSSASGTRC